MKFVELNAFDVGCAYRKHATKPLPNNVTIRLILGADELKYYYDSKNRQCLLAILNFYVFFFKNA